MCFGLETDKVVLRRTIARFPMPERTIKIINDWGKSQKTAGFKNKLEFWYNMKNKYDWENEDLDVSDGKVEVKPVNAYPPIYAEIPGVLIEYDLNPDKGAVQANHIPTIPCMAAATRVNACLALTP